MSTQQAKIVGIGLNKTATKSLVNRLVRWKYNHCFEYADAFQMYRANNIDGALDIMERYDSFEDWPWPLMYREIDERFPDAKFILTTRVSAEVWYESLCKMAVRIGPLSEYERFIYGSSMPQATPQHHKDFYNSHNAAVREYFADRPGKLLELCASTEGTTDRLAEFLGQKATGETFPKVNISDDVYGGSNLVIAHAARLRYQVPRKLRERFPFLDRSKPEG